MSAPNVLQLYTRSVLDIYDNKEEATSLSGYLQMVFVCFLMESLWKGELSVTWHQETF